MLILHAACCMLHVCWACRKNAPGALCVVDGEEVTRERKLLAWAGDMAVQRGELRRTRMELAQAREEIRVLRAELSVLRMEVRFHQTWLAARAISCLYAGAWGLGAHRICHQAHAQHIAELS